MPQFPGDSDGGTTVGSAPEAHLRAIIETAVYGVIVIDEHGSIESVNPAAARIFQYQSAELIGQNAQALIPELRSGTPDGSAAIDLQTLKAKYVGAERDVLGRRKDGSTFPMELAVSEVSSGDRRLYAGTFRDLTERRAMETALRDNETRFRLLADSAPVMIWISGPDKGYTWFSKPWLMFTGRSLQQAVGEGWYECVHPDDLSKCMECYRNEFDARRPFEIEYRLRRWDGEYRWIQDVGVPMYSANGDFAGYMGCGLDVTEHRRSELLLQACVHEQTVELTAANARLRAEVRQRRRAQALLASENRVLALIASGASLDDVLNVLCRAVQDQVPASRCVLRLAQKSGGMRSSADGVGGTAEAAPVAGLDLFGPKADAENAPPLTPHRIVTGGADSLQQTVGHKASWLEPVLSSTNELLGTIAVYLDTDRQPESVELDASATAASLAAVAIERARIEEEVRRQLAQLAHVTRLSTMGEMASGIAHELNQPLCAIVNFAEACAVQLESGGATGDVCQAVKEIAKQADRAGHVVRRLRDFIRRREPQRKEVDLNRVVREVVGLTKTEIRQQRIRIRLKLSQRLPAVSADPVQIQQVLVNLVRNASDAMREVGASRRVLTIQTSRRKDMVMLSLSDTGPGVPEKARERLFEPFYTTKQEGMGMGLSISRSIMEAHDGKIRVASTSGRGTTFQCLLPRLRRTPDE